eukprot:CCRYP_003320-RA/>CCRYP_003320-RA protein AED:0.28 eAED:0.28 QI:0/0/0/1/0/0/4/0/506
MKAANNSTTANSSDTQNRKLLGAVPPRTNSVAFHKALAIQSKALTPSNSYMNVTSHATAGTMSPMAVLKADPNRTRFFTSGDKCNYPYKVVTPTIEILVVKILFNSVVSIPGARFMTMDISNFYLMTPLLCPEYICIKLSNTPRQSHPKSHGMYGFPQAGLLANELLEKCLNQHGYFQSKYVPSLWRHQTRPVQFVLTVDDFVVKYVECEHAEHCYQVLCNHYQVTTDWAGEHSIGIHLRWDYNAHLIHLFMPGYVHKAITIIQHQAQCHKNQPFPQTPIKYSCGKFLFYCRAVDSTLLVPLSTVTSQSSAPTTDTLKQTRQLLNYLATQENDVLTYKCSDMKLAIHNDARYLSEPKVRSHAGGHFFLSLHKKIPCNNGAILNIAHSIKNVMSSTTEAELAALYIMAREAVYIRIILEEMGHKQPPNPIQTNNDMVDAVINGKVQPKRTKAIGMRFHWLCDCECHNQFKFYCRSGSGITNNTNYWTKHHSTAHHVNIWAEFLTPLI